MVIIMNMIIQNDVDDDHKNSTSNIKNCNGMIEYVKNCNEMIK